MIEWNALARLRLGLAAGAIAYTARAVNLWGNPTTVRVFDSWPYVWPLAYAAAAVLLAATIVAGPRCRVPMVGASTCVVIGLSGLRSWAVVGQGGLDNTLHVGANFGFLAAVVATTWPFMLRGLTLDRIEARGDE